MSPLKSLALCIGVIALLALWRYANLDFWNMPVSKRTAMFIFYFVIPWTIGGAIVLAIALIMKWSR